MEKAEVTDLYPWMEYQFRIIATNEHGSGEASIPSLKIKTWDARKDKKKLLWYVRYAILKILMINYFLALSTSCVSHQSGRLRRSKWWDNHHVDSRCLCLTSSFASSILTVEFYWKLFQLVTFSPWSLGTSMVRSLATSSRLSLTMLTTGGTRPSRTLRRDDTFTETPISSPLRKTSRCESFRWRSSHLMWKETDPTPSQRSSTIHEMVRPLLLAWSHSCFYYRGNYEHLFQFHFSPSSSVPTESPTDIYARPVSSTEALVWWLPVVDTGTGLQQYIEGYQVQNRREII